MKTANVTYVAPVGDSKVVEMGGLTFYDGKSVEINSFDNPGLFQKLQANPYFDFSMGKDEPDTVKPKVKRGRPSNADVAAAKAAADQAEKDRQDAEARAKAAKADAEAADKASRGDGENLSAPDKRPTSTGSTNLNTLADAPNSSTGIPLGGQGTKPAGSPNPVGLTGTSSAPVNEKQPVKSPQLSAEAERGNSPLPPQPSPLSEPTKVE